MAGNVWTPQLRQFHHPTPPQRSHRVWRRCQAMWTVLSILNGGIYFQVSLGSLLSQAECELVTLSH